MINEEVSLSEKLFKWRILSHIQNSEKNLWRLNAKIEYICNTHIGILKGVNIFMLLDITIDQ